MKYKNGINLVRELHPKNKTQWKVVVYKDGVITRTYYTQYIALHTTKIVLFSDELSYWIDGAIVYKYDIAQKCDSRLEIDALYIGLAIHHSDEVNEELLKRCRYEDFTTKKTRKRTKVLDSHKQKADIIPDGQST